MCEKQLNARSSKEVYLGFISYKKEKVGQRSVRLEWVMEKPIVGKIYYGEMLLRFEARPTEYLQRKRWNKTNIAAEKGKDDCPVEM